ncbi:hypothetical protein HWV62_6741 [Athelia sp. TMB]|nr:hypothetical protein HWV62_6741 [Athelia sp. TMB]
MAAYTHIIDGQMTRGTIVKRPCPTEMIIFVPVDTQIRKAIVLLRNAHNHPVHPKIKPTAADRTKFNEAVAACGINGLTVRKLLHAPSTSIIYEGKSIPEASPAYMSRRKMRDTLRDEKLKDYPKGLGWEGKFQINQLQTVTNPVLSRTVMTKGDIKLAVTMHPELVKIIHSVLYLCIDYTFKRVGGDDLNEWEVAGFSDRFKRRLTFASLYCNRATREAFHQLFREFADTIRRVTGLPLNLSSFGLGGKIQCIILDGEVAQAQGCGDWLIEVNNPLISGITTHDALELVQYFIKTCVVHFDRYVIGSDNRESADSQVNSNIDELPKEEVSEDDIRRLKGFVGLRTDTEIASWHAFCQNSSCESIQNWYAQKISHPWLLPSLNRFLSKMSPDKWDLSPNHTNTVESAHAGMNAETSIGVAILTAILQSRRRDELIVAELQIIEQAAVMPRRWNGSSEREHLNTLRRKWSARKTSERSENLAIYDELQEEKTRLHTLIKSSLASQKEIDANMKLLRHGHPGQRASQGDEENLNTLRIENENEKEARRTLRAKQKEVDQQIKALKDNELDGVRLNGRRKSTRVASRPNEDDTIAYATPTNTNSRNLHDDYGDVDHYDIGAEEHALPEFFSRDEDDDANLGASHLILHAPDQSSHTPTPASASLITKYQAPVPEPSNMGEAEATTSIANWERLLEMDMPDDDALNMFMDGLDDALFEAQGGPMV